jgi:hypothetical protein
MAFTDPKSTISTETVVVSEEIFTVTSPFGDIRGRYYTENYVGFYFYAEESTANIEYTLTWYDQEIGGTELGSHVFLNTPNRVVELSAPVLGPYLEITFSNLTGGASDVKWSGALANWTGVLGSRGIFSPENASNTLINQDPRVVNAGTTATFNASRTWPGYALFQFITTGTAYNVTLQFMETNGTYVNLRRFTNTGNGVVHPVHLPGTHVRAQYTNNDAGAATIGWFLDTAPLTAS